MKRQNWLLVLLVVLALTFPGTSGAWAKDQDSSGLLLPAGWRVQPYGYLKFDMSWDDSSVNNGDFITFVNPEDSQKRSDDMFSPTVRQTRLGARIFAPNIGDLKVFGRVEIDFENPGAGVENKSGVLLRHAYAQLEGADWSLLFGQTSDIISPLVPDTLNYTVGWFGGNVGYRHPQLQFSKWWQCPDKHVLKVQTALSQEIGQNENFGTVDDGKDSAWPSLLARVSYSLPANGKRIEVGLSGHYGREEIDWDYVGDDTGVNTASVNADFVVPLCKTLSVKGELFWGSNFNSYFGGIGQGVNSTTRDEIETTGGWAQIAYKPVDAWAFNLGGGIDDPRDADLENGDKTRNCFVFTNAKYYFSRFLSTGLELTYWSTGYKNSDCGDDFRVQHSWIFSF